MGKGAIWFGQVSLTGSPGPSPGPLWEGSGVGLPTGSTFCSSLGKILQGTGWREETQGACEWPLQGSDTLTHPPTALPPPSPGRGWQPQGSLHHFAAWLSSPSGCGAAAGRAEQATMATHLFDHPRRQPLLRQAIKIRRHRAKGLQDPLPKTTQEVGVTSFGRKAGLGGSGVLRNQSLTICPAPPTCPP